MNNHSSSSKQCCTQNNNNNLVIDKGNLRCTDEKSCCFYMKFPLKVNNNVYPEKTLNMKDGMDDYFEQFSSAAASDDLRNLRKDEDHMQHANGCDEDIVNDGRHPSFPDPINALNGEEEDEDEGCIYTYKGDNYEANLTHLLQTCFSCGLPTTERSEGQNGAVSIQRILNSSPHPNPNPESNAYSPEMDFLEMDFDPGSNGDGGDSDCEDNNSVLTLDAKLDDKPLLDSFIKLQQMNALKKTNNISNEMRNLMCRRCEMCVYNEQKVNNTFTNLNSKPHHESAWTGKLTTNPTPGPSFSSVSVVKSFSELSEEGSSKAFLNVSSESPLPHSLLSKNAAKTSDKESTTASVENNLNVFGKDFAGDESSDPGDEADDESGDDETRMTFGATFISRERLNALRRRSPPLKEHSNASFNLKTTKQLRFSGVVTNYDKSVNSSKMPLKTFRSSSLEASDHLADCNKESSFKEGEEKCENNNLGSISAPEVSPSKEYSPLEKFSRSISFHNQLSSPKYENVCFTHPYKDNFLPSINKYQLNSCTSHDHCSCKHLNCSCKTTQDLETTNLEACVDRLTQREKSVLNITTPPVNSIQVCRFGSSVFIQVYLNKPGCVTPNFFTNLFEILKLF